MLDPRKTLARFIRSPEWTREAPSRVERLAGDASTRAYFRLFFHDGLTMMASVAAGPGDQAGFTELQGFLSGLGLPVPALMQTDSTEMIVIQEDLGDDLLEYVLNGRPESELHDLYQQAVDLLVEMRKATDGLKSGCRAFDLAFDEEKLMWEMDFFLTHFVHGLCGLDPGRTALTSLKEFFGRICGTLADEPRVFTHRDYHARNLILHDGRLRMIDFQDARMGPAQYDLASLLRDSYVLLPESLVEASIQRYFEATRYSRDCSQEKFRRTFDIMSLQRSIKAMGTFGYQASVRGSARYLPAIPRTARYVAANIAKLSEFSEFRSAVEDYICGPALETDVHAGQEQ